MATRILLQTTIPPIEDDWNIGRFSRLAEHLAGLDGVEVVARDRAVPGDQVDPVLGSIDASDFDQLWLFAVDTGGGLNPDECAAIGRFRERGGGLMVTRDHMDLGSSVCTLGGIGDAHYFHSKHPDPEQDRNRRDDTATDDIDFPNYHSGANGDVQTITPVGEVHPLLRDGEGVIRLLPSHPHEGGVGAPAEAADARVIATGVSRTTGRPFNIAVVFEGEGKDGTGRGVAQSTFHHFADYNWDPRDGSPSFVTEPPGEAILRDPEGLRQTRAYMTNLARWLS